MLFTVTLEWRNAGKEMCKYVIFWMQANFLHFELQMYAEYVDENTFFFCFFGGHQQKF